MLIFDRLLIKARKMTYTKKNIHSAFEATGIVPVNEHRVLSPKKSTFTFESQQPAMKPQFQVPVTPRHGRSILIHGRKTLNALPKSTPRSQYNHALVTKLLNSAARATADNIILAIENANLREKATSVADRAKTKSRKEMSKARVISVEDVLRLRHEVEAKDHEQAERKARTAQRRATKATKSGPTNSPTPKQKQKSGKQVTINMSPEVIALGNLNLGSDSDPEWIDSGSDTGYPGASKHVTQPQPQRITRSQLRGTS